LAGKLAVALVPMPSKLSVTGREPEIEICDDAAELAIIIQNRDARKMPTCFMKPPQLLLLLLRRPTGEGSASRENTD
jgi:hypothetical protein